jgi:hypothetical protein
LKSFATADSAKIQASTNEFDPDHYQYRFAATPTCDNPDCAEKAVIAGSGYIERMDYIDDKGEWDLDFVDTFSIEYFSPSPSVLPLPKQCPEPVKTELSHAFSAWWNDCSAAGNHIRSAVERMMDDLGVRKASRTKTGKLSRLSLHQRIKEIPTKYSEAQDALLAIKWLGNAGSHSSVLVEADIFDALDLFEIALEHVYVKHHAAMKKLAKAVVRRQGPVRKH